MNVPRALTSAAEQLDGVTRSATVGRWDVAAHSGMVSAPLDTVGSTWVAQDAAYIATMGPRVGRKLAHLLRAINAPAPDAEPSAREWTNVRVWAAMLCNELLGETPELYDWEERIANGEDAPYEAHEKLSPESHDDLGDAHDRFPESHEESSPDAHEESGELHENVTRTAADVLEADLADWRERHAEEVERQARINFLLDYLTLHIEVRKNRPGLAYTPGGKLLLDSRDGGLCK